MPVKRKRGKRRRPGISAEIVGDEIGHLKNVNREFQRDLNENLLRIAIRPTADFVETMMKAITPRKTGFLAGTITQKESKLSAKSNQVKIRVGPNYRKFKGYFYAAVQEFGSGKRNIPAVRFVRRARRAAQPILLRLLERAMNGTIKNYTPPTPDEARRAA